MRIPHLPLVAMALAIPGALSAQTPMPASVELWRGLRVGMSGEEVSTILRQMPGVDKVSVKSSKDGTTKVDVNTSRSFVVAEQYARIIPGFAGSALSSVNLIVSGNPYGTPCENEVARLHVLFDSLLSAKYTAAGQSSGVSLFKNDTVAVRVSEELRESFGKFDADAAVCAKRGNNRLGYLKVQYIPVTVLDNAQQQNEQRAQRAIDGL